MTTRLLIYNDALQMCGERSIADLTENREPRYLLDHVWDNSGVDACLEEGQWKFATRTVLLDYDTGITNEFGYKRAFAKPDDWVLTSSVCSDEFFNVPLIQYVDEAGYWYAELDQIYVRFISNHANYGGDLTTWTQTFADFVAAHFASKIVSKLTSDEKKKEEVKQNRKELLKIARSRDAMADPTKFPAEGGWNRSRRSRGGSRRDRGNRNRLTG